MENLESYAVKKLGQKKLVEVEGGNRGWALLATAIWLEVRDAWEDGSVLNEEAYEAGREAAQEAIN